MKIEELSVLREYCTPGMLKSYIKEDKEKTSSLVNFIKLIKSKDILTSDEISEFVIRYKLNTYGQTFLDMINILEASNSKVAYKTLIEEYNKLDGSSREDYEILLQDIVTVYGNCNDFFSDEYLDYKVSMEEKASSESNVTVFEFLKKGGTVDNLQKILVREDISEFNGDTKIYVNSNDIPELNL